MSLGIIFALRYIKRKELLNLYYDEIHAKNGT